MLEYLVWAFWFLLGVYIFWFLTRVKKAEPLTLDEVVILWRIHRLETGCKCPRSKVTLIIEKYSKETSGFKCACDYSYTSSHLLIQRPAFRCDIFAISPDTPKEVLLSRGTPYIDLVRRLKKAKSA